MQEIHAKMAVRGIEALDDCELLALLLESRGLAEEVLRECGSLAVIARTDLRRLRMVEGIGLKRAERLQVAAEFGRRIARASETEVECISTDRDVARLMRPVFEGMKHEECWVLYLTSSNRLLERQRVSQGGVQATVVDHRLIVKRALELLSTQIILVHNHPSGAASPSDADKVLTRKIKEAAALFDIQLLDHIIISSEGHFSLRREGMM